MDKQEFMYRCMECGRTVNSAPAEDPPECCGKAMKEDPLPRCTSADQAEMVRNEDAGDPCDDGRADSG